MEISERNNLYPIFLKVHELNVLIVGGGNVALEKLSFLLKSSPEAKVKVVSLVFDDALVELAKRHEVTLVKHEYDSMFLSGQHIVIGATNNKLVNKEIHREAKVRNLLVNIADTPELCDFYLGGIVTKGNVKIAISTNGKSPTMAKRLRQFFEDVLPDNLDNLVINLNNYRKTLKNKFEFKVNKLNEITKSLVIK